MTNTNTSIGLGNEYLIGYITGEQYLVTNTVEQICAFIAKARLDDAILVDILDQAEIETSVGFISYCKNQKFLTNELLPTLVPIQKGEVKAAEFIPYIVEDFILPEDETEGEICINEHGMQEENTLSQITLKTIYLAMMYVARNEKEVLEDKYYELENIINENHDLSLTDMIDNIENVYNLINK